MSLPGFELGAPRSKSKRATTAPTMIYRKHINFIFYKQHTKLLEKYIKCYCQLINVFYKFKTYCMYHIYDKNVTVIF